MINHIIGDIYDLLIKNEVKRGNIVRGIKSEECDMSVLDGIYNVFTETPFISGELLEDVYNKIYSERARVKVRCYRYKNIKLYTTDGIKRVIDYFMVMCLMGYCDNNRNGRVYIIPINKSKHFRFIDGDKMLGIDGINSASTTVVRGCDGCGDILIWRRDEVIKVLIHEILHSLNYDSCLYGLSKQKQKRKLKLFYDRKDRKGRKDIGLGLCLIGFNIGETYVEMIAVLYNIGLYILRKYGMIGYKRFMNIYMDLYNRELLHTYRNVVRVMSVNGMGVRDMDGFIGGGYRQGTSVFEYFVLRSALFRYILKNDVYMGVPRVMRGVDMGDYIYLLLDAFNDCDWRGEIERVGNGMNMNMDVKRVYMCKYLS